MPIFKTNFSKSLLKRSFALASMGLLLTVASCRVQQEEAGEAPEIDVEAEGGNLPEYDVDTPDVDVSTEEETVTTPELEVDQEETTIETPEVDVSLPGEEGQSE